jgi:hypothetical protein
MSKLRVWISAIGFKASDWVTAALTAALVIVGIIQISIYNRQNGILKAQNVISTRKCNYLQIRTIYFRPLKEHM